LKFAKDSYWLKSGSYTLLNRISDFLFGFAGFLMLIRIFSKEEFGVWVLFITVTSLIEIARASFIQNAFIKFSVAAELNEYKKILTASFFMNALITLLSIILFLSLGNILGSVWNSPELPALMYLYTITMLFYAPFAQFIVVMQAKFNFKGIFYSQLFRSGAFFLFILSVFLLKYKIALHHLVIAQLLFVAPVSSVIAYLFVKKDLLFSRNLSREWVGKLFRYSKFVFGTSMTSMLTNSMDKFLIGGLLTSAQVASFNAASRVLNLFDVPLFSVASIVFPKSAERMEKEGKQAVKYLYERSVGLMIAMTLPFFVSCFIFAELIIKVIAGNEYLDSVPVLRVVIFLSILKPFDRQSGSFLDAIGKPNLNFITVIINFFTTISVLYVFIKFAGIMGAAFGSLLSLFIAVVISHIILYKLLNINPFNTFIYAYKFYSDGFIIARKFLTKEKTNNSDHEQI